MDKGASNYKVVSIDPKNKEEKNWKTIISEQKELLEGARVVSNKIYATYLKDASNKVVEYSLEGKLLRTLELPGIGTVSFAPASKKDQFMFYSFTNFTTPGTIYKLDINSGVSTLYTKPNFKLNTDNFETKQVWFTSKDGTKVPMFIVHMFSEKLTSEIGNFPRNLDTVNSIFTTPFDPIY
jgi:prolyl oligopeptidase